MQDTYCVARTVYKMPGTACGYSSVRDSKNIFAHLFEERCLHYSNK